MCEIIIIIISLFFLFLSNILAASIIFVIYYTISFTISVGRCIDQPNTYICIKGKEKRNTNISFAQFFVVVVVLLPVQHSDESLFRLHLCISCPILCECWCVRTWFIYVIRLLVPMAVHENAMKFDRIKFFFFLLFRSPSTTNFMW